MAGWHSLSGYLYYRPGGALGKLKVRRRYWYLYEETQCVLQNFKNQEDASRQKEPIGQIDIRGAAITLSLTDDNQFSILSEGKEHILTADNHESMMIWLMGLQAKRDAAAKGLLDKSQQNDVVKVKFADDQHSELDIHDEQVVKIDPLSLSWDFRSVRTDPVIQGARHKELELTSRRKSVMTAVDLQRQKRLARRLGSSVSMEPGLMELEDDDPISRNLDGILDSEHSPNMSPRASAKHSLNRQVSEPVSPPHIKTEFEATVLDTLQNELIGESSSPEGSVTEEPGLALEDADSASAHSIEAGIEQERNAGASGQRRVLKKMQSDITDAKMSLFYARQGEQEREREKTAVERINEKAAEREKERARDSSGDDRDRNDSLSGQSSDSAMERSSEAELMLRLTDIEQELIQAKCELAKMKNKETCYKTILEKRDSLIVELDEKLEQLTERTTDTKAGGDKRLREQLRVLQNQNRFLNEEVKKLAQLQQKEREKYKIQDDKFNELQSCVDKWKRDYVYLLQSSVTVPTGDLTDGMEVSLFGGNRHKERIQELIVEARAKNPGLPTFEKLSRSEFHIDSYGFKHVYHNEGLLLHYLCQQLHQFYTSQLSTYEEHQRRWKDVLTRAKSTLIKTSTIFGTQLYKELKHLCRRGIPVQYRRDIWKHLVYHHVQDIMEEKGPHYFSNLVNNTHESQFAGQNRKQIGLDLLRTMPNNVHFNSVNSQGIQNLQDVLLAFCIHNRDAGYCQGMNFITSMCLLFMEPEDAFWCLIAITEKYFTTNYFDQYLSGAQADQEVLRDLMREKLPRLATHLENLEIDISTVTLNWFLPIFFDAVPFETLIRVWDCFLLEGPKILFRFALAILKHNEPSILQKTDTISIMRHLKSCAALTFDIEGLVKTAFEDMRPFPRRHDISVKQAVFLKTLGEKLHKQELQRRAYDEKEEMFREIEVMDSPNTQVFECATLTQQGHVWICYGEQNYGKVCFVNCDDSAVVDLGIEVHSRIMCMCCVGEDIILLGTLSWGINAYSSSTREELWSIKLHDTVLSLCSYEREEEYNIVFAALADGTVAVIENVNTREPGDDPFYINVGRSPVTSLCLIESQLWCACGNNVHILHAETMDAMDKFTVSANPFDHILTICRCDNGVWISVKGSSTVELWDYQQLSCKMVYDIKEHKHPTLQKEDDGYVNLSRITTILPIDNSVWIGTGDGNLVMFDIIATIPGQNPEGLMSAEAEVLTGYGNGSASDHESNEKRRDIMETKVSELYVETLHQEREHLTNLRKQKQMETDSLNKEVMQHMQNTDNSASTSLTSSGLTSPDTVSSEAKDAEAEQGATGDPISPEEEDTSAESQRALDENANNKQRAQSDSDKATHSKGAGTAVATSQKKKNSKSSSSSDSSRESDDTVISVEGNERAQASKDDEISRDPEPSKKDKTGLLKQSLQLQIGPAQNLTRLSPITETRESLQGTPVTPLDKPNLVPVKGNKADLRIEIPPIVRITKHEASPALPRTPSNTPDLPRKHPHEARADSSAGSDLSGYDELSPPFSPPNGPSSSRSHVPKSRRANLRVSAVPYSAGAGSQGLSSGSYAGSLSFQYELQLQARIKTADKPIRCLIFTRSNFEPIVISCAGSYGDDEAILKWKKERDEKLWTNEPVFEICPETNKRKTPLYARQMSGASSHRSSGSTDSILNFFSNRKHSLSRKGEPSDS